MNSAVRRRAIHKPIHIPCRWPRLTKRVPRFSARVYADFLQLREVICCIMYALVRYVEIITDNRLHVIPVGDILNFHPTDEFDFDNKKTYTAVWHDEKDEANSGQYVIQILRLAG